MLDEVNATCARRCWFTAVMESFSCVPHSVVIVCEISAAVRLTGVWFLFQNAGPAPSPLGQMPPGEGMAPQGAMPPGFFPVSGAARGGGWAAGPGWAGVRAGSVPTVRTAREPTGAASAPPARRASTRGRQS